MTAFAHAHPALTAFMLGGFLWTPLGFLICSVLTVSARAEEG